MIKMKDQELHDLLSTGLEEAIQDYIDMITSGLNFREQQGIQDDRPTRRQIARITKQVLDSFAALPGEHWLWDEEDGYEWPEDEPRPAP
jgi:hypothetical protein